MRASTRRSASLPLVAVGEHTTTATGERVANRRDWRVRTERTRSVSARQQRPTNGGGRRSGQHANRQRPTSAVASMRASCGPVASAMPSMRQTRDGCVSGQGGSDACGGRWVPQGIRGWVGKARSGKKTCFLSFRQKHSPNCDFLVLHSPFTLCTCKII
jgi:hypothetical protein